MDHAEGSKDYFAKYLLSFSCLLGRRTLVLEHWAPEVLFPFTFQSNRHQFIFAMTTLIVLKAKSSHTENSTHIGSCEKLSVFCKPCSYISERFSFLSIRTTQFHIVAGCIDDSLVIYLKAALHLQGLLLMWFSGWEKIRNLVPVVIY